MYDLGIDVTGDVAEATKWYRQAAQQGHRGAQTRLCKLPNTEVECARLSGQLAQERTRMDPGWIGDDTEVRRNLPKLALQAEAARKRTLAKLTQAAEQGDIEAQYKLGNQYRWGPEQDLTQAVKWWRAAASAGHVSAKKELCLLKPECLQQQQEEERRVAEEEDRRISELEASRQAEQKRLAAEKIHREFGSIGVLVSSDWTRGIRSQSGDPASAAVLGLLYGGPAGAAVMGAAMPFMSLAYHMKGSVREAKKQMKNILTESEIYEQLREEITKAASHPGFPLTPLVEPGRNSYRDFHERGIDTVVHVVKLGIWLNTQDPEFKVTSAQFHMNATVDFVRTKDAELIDEQVFQYVGQTYNTDHWISNEGQELRVSVENGRQNIAEQIALALPGLPINLNGLIIPPSTDAEQSLKRVTLLPLVYTISGTQGDDSVIEYQRKQLTRTIKSAFGTDLVESYDIEATGLLNQKKVWNRQREDLWKPNLEFLYARGKEVELDAVVMASFVIDELSDLSYLSGELYVIDLQLQRVLKASLPRTTGDLELEKKLTGLFAKVGITTGSAGETKAKMK